MAQPQAESSNTDEEDGWLPQYDNGPSPLENIDEDRKNELIREYLRENVASFSNFCEICQKILLEVLYHNTRTIIGRKIPQKMRDLERSAVKGCRFCKFRFEHNSATSLAETSKMEYDCFPRLEGLIRELVFECENHKRGEYARWKINLSRGSSCDSPSTLIRLNALRQLETSGTLAGPVVSDDTHDYLNSYISFETAKTWIQECTLSHKSCTKGWETKKELPTRLIDLGPGKMIKPRLCFGKNLSAETVYVTLSHCWGGIQLLKLEHRNLARFKQRIPVTQLSKTFRDAMEISKRLEIRYIWIDSLCIIQDSMDDWREESSRMAEIYGCSYCNIAAASASDGEAGCFGVKERQTSEATHLDFEVEGDTWTCTRSDRIPDDIDNRYFIKSMLQGPLYQRAWVTQEVVLSPRTLNFWNGSLVWVCGTRYSDESTDVKIKYDPTSFPKPILPLRTTRNSRIEKSNLNSWFNIVEHYSGAYLTYAQQDKLVAISGIANKIGDQVDYIAGLWKPFLEDQLGWFRDPERDEEAAVVRLRYPSWSWASLGASVRYDVGLDNLFSVLYDDCSSLRVHDIQCEHSRGFGDEESDATLVVEGNLFCLRYKNQQRLRFGSVFQNLERGISMRRRLKQLRLGLTLFRYELRADSHWDNPKDCGRDGDLVYFTFLDDPYDNYDLYGIRGLLLCPQHKDGYYTRVGFVYIRKYDFKDFFPFSRSSEKYIDARPELFEQKVLPVRENEHPRYIFKIR